MGRVESRRRSDAKPSVARGYPGRARKEAGKMANGRGYWLDLFTWETWTEFLKAGAAVSGFREGRRSTVLKIKPGDYLLCYLTGISRFIAVLEATSEPFEDESPIWAGEVFPWRVTVNVVHKLEAETAVPVAKLFRTFSWYGSLKSEAAWTGYFRGSPWRMAESDGEMVSKSVADAAEHPTVVAYDPKRLRRPVYKPKAKSSGYEPASAEKAPNAQVKDSAIACPELESTPVEPLAIPSEAEPEEVAKEVPAHREMQWLLGKLGNDLGLTVWLPPSDRGLEFKGHKFSELDLGDLPMMFSHRQLRTVRQIDVIWLGDGSIESAFEIESTTSIYSGILRLADLIVLVPGITIPLYVVGPDERREKVYSELTRPAFGKLSPPMFKACRYIPFSALRLRLPAEEMRRFMNPQFIRTLSEECTTDSS